MLITEKTFKFKDTSVTFTTLCIIVLLMEAFLLFALVKGDVTSVVLGMAVFPAIALWLGFRIHRYAQHFRVEIREDTVYVFQWKDGESSFPLDEIRLLGTRFDWVLLQQVHDYGARGERFGVSRTISGYKELRSILELKR
jgi:hypothetical protein